VQSDDNIRFTLAKLALSAKLVCLRTFYNGVYSCRFGLGESQAAKIFSPVLPHVILLPDASSPMLPAGFGFLVFEGLLSAVRRRPV
jgi:hypothetical protein